jgi:RNA polymerase sigma-70 factor (ECF subfamily)
MSRAEEAELIRRYLPFIEGYFRSRVAGAEDAEDLAQEAAMAVIRAWPGFQHRSAPTTWIYAICRNILCRHIRRRGGASFWVSEVEIPETHPEDFDQLALAIAVEGMAPSRRKLHELYYRLGHSVREVAAILGKPEGTVKYELYLLRTELRRILT